MQLLSSWRDSLALFKPAQFKPFSLVTIKAICEAYRTTISYFWWLWLLVIGSVGFVWYQGMQVSQGISALTPNQFLALAIMAEIASVALFFCVCLAVRPSVMRKDYTYFVSYLRYVGTILIVSFVIGLVSGLYVNLIRYLPPRLSWWAEVITIALALMGPIVTSPWYLSFVFFFLDSDGSLAAVGRSIGRAFKMVLYNYPVFLLFHGVFMVSMMAVAQIGLFFHVVPLQVVLTCALTLLQIIPICIFANLYVKSVHQQSELYFKQP